jgi:hypothetical protein
MANYAEYNLTYHSDEEDIFSIENTQAVFRVLSSSSNSSSGSSSSNSNSIAVEVIIKILCCDKEKHGI